MSAKQKNPAIWRPTWVEDVWDLAAKVGKSAEFVTDVLNRDAAPGVRLAKRFRVATGVPEKTWIEGALPGVSDHPAFLQPPDRPGFLSSLRAVHFDRGPAGDFWRKHIDSYAATLNWPVSLLAHVIVGNLAVGRWPSALGERLGLIIGMEPSPHYSSAGTNWRAAGDGYFPTGHPLRVHLPPDAAKRSF